MKKEILTPGNIVLGGSEVIKLKELRDLVAVDNNEVSWPYEKLDGLLITYENLKEDGYTVRMLTTPSGTRNDLVKLISINDSVFYTISIYNLGPGFWRLEIQDNEHRQICSCNVTYWHTLQNFISAYVLS